MNIFHWIVILIDIAAMVNVFILEPPKKYSQLINTGHKSQSVTVYSYGKVVSK